MATKLPARSLCEIFGEAPVLIGYMGFVHNTCEK